MTIKYDPQAWETRIPVSLFIGNIEISRGKTWWEITEGWRRAAQEGR